jgi:uridine phosphorylase
MATPLDEFDPGDDVFVRPKALADRFPRALILCFFPEAIEELRQRGRLVRIGGFNRELGGAGIFATPDRRIAGLHPGVGGPLSGHCFEQAIASGVTSAIAVGGAGSLTESFGLGDVLVVGSAVRDEGTSFHYAPATREIALDGVEARRVLNALGGCGIPARIGTVWTTAADFRETRDRVARRRAEGCEAVEMEAAALAAVAAFRGVRYAHVLYGGDDLSGETWAHRSWTTSSRRAELLDALLQISGADATATPTLHEQVQRLEVALLTGEVRRDPAQVAELLHPDFREIGRSGTMWTRDDIVASLAAEPAGRTAPATDEWEFADLAPGILQVTYRITTPTRVSRHSSIWDVDATPPRLRFHQGTVVPDVS